jgi:aryl-alcohol dehydrogenase-like predicted oxidoreductase
MSESIDLVNFTGTNIKVTPIGLGVWQFSGRGYWAALPTETMNAIVRTALDEGINWFDTAELYGRGKSERYLSNALKTAGKKDGDIVIATKWLPILRRAKNLFKNIDKRFYHLDGFSIDLYQIHISASFSSIKNQMQHMAELVRKGKIKSVGVSNFNTNIMRKAHEELEKYDIPLVSNQVKYNLLKRKKDYNGFLDTAKELGIKVIAYSPLGQGVLTGRFHKNPASRKEISFVRKHYTVTKRKIKQAEELIDTLEKIGQIHNVSISTVALCWLINYHKDLVVAIPGASKPEQVKMNAKAMRIKLSTAELKELDEKSQAI